MVMVGYDFSIRISSWNSTSVYIVALTVTKSKPF